MASMKALQFAFAVQNVGIAAAAADYRYIIGSVTAIGIEYMGNPLIYETWHCQKRFMKSRRVQDRSKKKKEPAFEKVMERQKPLTKVLTVMDILKHEPEQVMTLKSLTTYRRQLKMTDDERIPVFLRKHPKLFELYKDQRGVKWCGLTAQAENLLEEELRLKKEYESTAVNYVRRLLMMSVDKTLQVDKIAHFKREFGLPDDFKREWIYSFPEYFRVVRTDDDVLYLKLTSWDPALAVTELERKAKEGTEQNVEDNSTSGVLTVPFISTSGLLTVPFPLRWPLHLPRHKRPDISTKNFQELPYLSPYADPSDLVPGSKEFEKRAVAVLHEILSFTLEKRLIADHLTHFRWEFRLPQKLMRLFLRYFGIFYVSPKGKRFHVFLTTAYEGCELIEKRPLVLWKEKVEKLLGESWKRKRGKIAYVDGDEALDGDEILVRGDYDKEEIIYRDEHSSGYHSVKEDKDVADGMEDDIMKELVTDDEMEVQEVLRAYER